MIPVLSMGLNWLRSIFWRVRGDPRLRPVFRLVVVVVSGGGSFSRYRVEGVVEGEMDTAMIGLPLELLAEEVERGGREGGGREDVGVLVERMF